MFSKQYRLRKDDDFELIFRKGKAFKIDFLFLKLRENNLGFSRFGFIIGKKISKKSTVRNRIKRKLKENIRRRINKIKPGFDVVVGAGPEIVGKDYKDIDQTVEQLFKKAKLI